MKVVIITLLVFLLPLQAQAQAVELTLNCQYGKTWHALKDQKSELSGSFSAIVRMQTDGTAMIETTTSTGCTYFAGSSNEKQVEGECKSPKDRTWLEIDRISCAFELKPLIDRQSPELPTSDVWYYGHCKPSSKLF